MVLLGDVIKVNPESISKGYQYNQIEYIDISSVGTGTLSGTTQYELKDAPGRAKRLVKDGDTIVATVRPNLRSFLYIKNPKPNLVVSTGFAVLRPRENIDSRFLYYTVTNQAFTDYLVSRVKGAAYPAVDVETFEKAEINLPSLPTQRKIAAILSTYDDLIENNTRRIKILEEMAQLIYREWFVKFRFPGHEKVKMVESELGPIPEGWEVKNIGSLLAHTIGGGWGEVSRSDKYTVPAYVIRGTDIPNVRQGSIESCPLRYHTESNFRSRKLKAGDIVFEVSGGSKGQPVGRALLINQSLLNSYDNDVICASFCKLIRPDKETILPELIYLHLLEIYANGVIEKYQVQSTGITNFKYEFFLKNDQILVPDREIQQNFADHIIPIFDMIQKLGAKNRNLRRTRDLLLPKLISGELDVEDLDIAVGGD